MSGQDLQSYDEVQKQVNEAHRQLDAAKAEATELETAKAQIAELQARIRRLSGEP